MQILGLDIGGANIKAANIDGKTCSVAFPMWNDHLKLPQALEEITNRMDCQPDLIGLTMTAELADCFGTKSDGVRYVIESVVNTFPKAEVRIWLTSSEFAEPADALELPELVAAANWHAQSTWLARSIPTGSAILLDMGSTTTDIIPLHDGWPVPVGLNDRDRLRSGELLYLGAHRTPLCAVLQEVDLEGDCFAVAAEFFATMADAVLVCGITDDRPDCIETADGRPLTQQHSLTRIARMLCCDRTELTDQHIVGIAEQALETVIDRIIVDINLAIERLRSESGDSSCQPILILSGSGSDLTRSTVVPQVESLFSSVMQLSTMYHSDISASACAFAVARLVQDRCRVDLLDESLF